MAGAPHHIHLLPDTKPYACHTPAAVARHWKSEVKRQLDEDIRHGVIRQVPDEGMETYARMVVLAKMSCNLGAQSTFSISIRAVSRRHITH